MADTPPTLSPEQHYRLQRARFARDMQQYPGVTAPLIAQLDEAWRISMRRDANQYYAWNVQISTPVHGVPLLDEQFREASVVAWLMVAATSMIDQLVVGTPIAPVFDVPGGVVRAAFDGVRVSFTFAATSALDWRPLGPLSTVDRRLFVEGQSVAVANAVAPELDAHTVAALQAIVATNTPSPRNTYATYGTMIARANALRQQLSDVYRRWRACAYCRRDTALYRCPVCIATLYCDAACQNADWRPRHRAECPLVRDLQQLNEAACRAMARIDGRGTSNDIAARMPVDAFFAALIECSDVLRRNGAPS